MKGIRVSILLFLPFLCFSQNKSDTLDLFSMSLEELINVKVSVASNVVEELRKQPASVTTITHEQLELSGARTLADAIMLFVPGVFVVEDQDDTIIGFRGLAADNNSKVLLLVNGINLNTEFFWGPPGAILNSTNYDYIDRIEVIRGPGSVTLGQGALLGVINIVTKDFNTVASGSTINADVALTSGLDQLWAGTGHLAIKNNKLRAYVNGGISHYNGQTLRNEGWARDRVNEGFRGGAIADIGTRLKRTDNEHLIAGISMGDFNFTGTYFNQSRDLYSFYRDRNQIRQTQWTTALSYSKRISNSFSLQASVNYSLDDFGLSSIEGYTMGGTSENRRGAKLLLKNNSFEMHSLAFGGEYRHFDMGHENRNGHNFINNVVTDDVSDPNYIAQSNLNKQFVYHQRVNLYSFFAEDYVQMNDSWAVFAAIRYDNHTFWDTNISPRVGSFVQVRDDLSLKFTFQQGFRGAVGLLYSGGFRGDGFLQSENFSEVESAQINRYDDQGNVIGIEPNLAPTRPEKIASSELTVSYDWNEKVNFTMVGFYNKVKNVIDVGVIFRDPEVEMLPNIGTDVPGDWNGYWFFKNTEGSIDAMGMEMSVFYKSDGLFASLNHSLVEVVSADEQQKGSMYLNAQNHFKAYPQNVTRLNALLSLGESVSIGANGLYYYKWFSPSDQEVPGNFLVNASLRYKLFSFLELSLHGLNLLGADNLYPMTNNVNEANLSDGAPAVEQTSFWLKAKVRI